MDSKIYRKKLTNAGGASCVFAAIALIISILGIVQYFVLEQVYNRRFDDEMLFTESVELIDFLVSYGSSIAVGVVSFVSLIILAANKNKKCLGGGLGGMLSMASLACIAQPAIMIVYMIDIDYIQQAIDSDSDNVMFAMVIRLLSYAIPACAGLFLLISGLIIMLKVAGERFTVDCPIISKSAAVMQNNTMPANEQEVVIPISNQSSTAIPVTSTQDAIIPENTFCNNCGRELNTGERFCRNCGNPVA